MVLRKLLSPARVRSLAGDRSYERGLGYQAERRVELGESSTTRVEAIVRGRTPYSVWIEAEGEAVCWACSCPMGEDGSFCKHCVAVAIELGNPPKEIREDGPSLRGRVESMDRAHLVDLLVEVAESDQLLRRRIERRSEPAEPPDMKAWRGDIREAFAPYGRFVSYQDGPDWARGVDSVLDELEDLAQRTPSDEVARLLEYAHQRADRAINYIDDSDGWLTGICQRLSDMHIDVCERGDADPVKLARRLVKLELESELDGFHRAARTHQASLGERGLVEYRRLITPEWETITPNTDMWSGNTFRIRQAMIGLALAGGDPDELIEVLSRDRMLPSDYLEVVEALVAAGRTDEAVDWARRGLAEASHHQARSLRDYLAGLLRSRGDDLLAADLYWEEYKEKPGPDTYRRFLTENEGLESSAVLKDRALGWLRNQPLSETSAGWGDPHAVQLIAVLLYEGEIDEAWQVAVERGCSTSVWLDLARARERTHPEQAIGVYVDAAREEIAKAKRDGYQAAMKHLRRIEKLVGQDAGFAGIIGELRTTHRRKTSLMAMFDKAGW